MNSTTKIVVWAAVAVLAGIIAVLAMSPKGASVENVDAEGLAGLAGDGVRVIDVRTAGEFEAGHVPGAENVPLDQLANALAGWDTSQPLAVYCATGARSTEAVTTLTRQGFTKIYHFNAGMVAWDGEVERGAVAVAQAFKPTETPVMYEFFTEW